MLAALVLGAMLCAAPVTSAAHGRGKTIRVGKTVNVKPVKTQSLKKSRGR